MLLAFYYFFNKYATSQKKGQKSQDFLGLHFCYKISDKFGGKTNTFLSDNRTNQANPNRQAVSLFFLGKSLIIITKLKFVSD